MPGFAILFLYRGDFLCLFVLMLMANKQFCISCVYVCLCVCTRFHGYTQYWWCLNEKTLAKFFTSKTKYFLTRFGDMSLSSVYEQSVRHINSIAASLEFTQNRTELFLCILHTVLGPSCVCLSCAEPHSCSLVCFQTVWATGRHFSACTYILLGA